MGVSDRLRLRARSKQAVFIDLINPKIINKGAFIMKVIQIAANLIGFVVLFFAIQWVSFIVFMASYVKRITEICLATGMYNDDDCPYLLNELPHEVALQSAPFIAIFALCALISMNFMISIIKSKKS